MKMCLKWGLYIGIFDEKFKNKKSGKELTIAHFYVNVFQKYLLITPDTLVNSRLMTRRKCNLRCKYLSTLSAPPSYTSTHVTSIFYEWKHEEHCSSFLVWNMKMNCYLYIFCRFHFAVCRIKRTWLLTHEFLIKKGKMRQKQPIA